MQPPAIGPATIPEKARPSLTRCRRTCITLLQIYHQPPTCCERTCNVPVVSPGLPPPCSPGSKFLATYGLVTCARFIIEGLEQSGNRRTLGCQSAVQNYIAAEQVYIIQVCPRIPYSITSRCIPYPVFVTMPRGRCRILGSCHTVLSRNTVLWCLHIFAFHTPNFTLTTSKLYIIPFLDSQET